MAVISALATGACSVGSHAGKGSSTRAAGLAQERCFASPGSCGYPDPAYRNVGSTSPCSSLTASGPITASRPGETIHDLAVTGTITVRAPNVTIDDVCVTVNGRGQLGSAAISLLDAASGTVIEHTTVAGQNSSDRSVAMAVLNHSGGAATLSHAYVYDCGECVHDQPWAINDSYIVSNGMQGTSEHIEDVYCNDGTITAVHDTLLNPQNSVAEVFCDTNDGRGGACRNHVAVRNSLLAGGGFVLYPCGNASSAGSSTMTVTGNRVARCTTPPFRQTADGGWTCGGVASERIGSGADSSGYWPNGGHYGVAAYTFCPPRSGQVWSRNVWDDSGGLVGC